MADCVIIDGNLSDNNEDLNDFRRYIILPITMSII